MVDIHPSLVLTHRIPPDVLGRLTTDAEREQGEIIRARRDAELRDEDMRHWRTLGQVIAVIAAAVAVAILAACGPAKPAPSLGPMPYSRVGDGSWSVGDELKPGRWRSVERLEGKAECVWYLTPTPEIAPPPDGQGRIVVQLHAGALTTYHCGDWERVS